MTVRTGLFHYVPWDSIDTFHREGWMVVAPLGEHSVLMWACDCSERPSLPNQERAA